MMDKPNYLQFENGIGSDFDKHSLRSYNSRTKNEYGNEGGGDLLEMMAIPGGGDRQYIEEPSKRGSFLEDKNEKLVE
jgi:drug/metabolite transporter (DMT)-like permease